MSEARRIFGPPLAKRNPVRNAAPKLTVDYPDKDVALGKDSEIAELNAQRVAPDGQSQIFSSHTAFITSLTRKVCLRINMRSFPQSIAIDRY